MNTKMICLVLVVILPVSLANPALQELMRPSLKTSVSEKETSLRVNADLCPLCIQFTGEALNALLNLILNGGVIDGCGTLCGDLANKTGNKVLGEVCSILCDVVGVEEFIKLITKADLDPIYFCELLKTCAIFDGGDALITNLTITPKSGPQGEKHIDIEYMSQNGTGTGELVVSIQTVDGIPIESVFLKERQQPGKFQELLKIKAQPDPNCDPSQGPCEMWLPGNYTLAVEICNGECGSKHPHSKVYDKQRTPFVINQN